MSTRTGIRHWLSILMLVASLDAAAQTGTLTVAGTVTSYEKQTAIATIDELTVYVGDIFNGTGIDLVSGDHISLVGFQVDATAGFVWAIALRSPQLNVNGFPSASGAGRQSIGGTEKKSIIGVATSMQSITGTGRSMQSITGTGRSVQSITGTGRSMQSITGTGRSVQSITGTGRSMQSITGTGRSGQSITGTGRVPESIGGIAVSALGVSSH
jgi:hypothetical protein